MKIRTFISLWAIQCMLCTACTKNDNTESVFQGGIIAEMSGYESAAPTKVAFPDGLSHFVWSNGDCIGICRSGSTSNGTAAFTILKGGTSSGSFINDAFSLNPSSNYFAFYPFTVTATSTHYPINLVGQCQEANNDLNHIGDYNYMYTNFTTGEDKSASFTFSNICSVIQVHFTTSGEGVYKNLTISSDGTQFITRAEYNFTTNEMIPKSTTNSITLSFGDGVYVNNGESFTASIVVFPQDMSTSTLTFSVNGDESISKSFSLAGFAMIKSKLYHFYEDDSKGNPPYGGCPDGNHPHMIDLGLPSGTLWACCDLGSNYPTEEGIHLAWGETAMAEKNTSNWENYIFMTDTYTDWTGISKYQIPDNKYEGIWYAADSTFIGDNIKTLMMEDDAARVNWGGKWRTPTKEEIEELINYTHKVGTDNYNGTGQKGQIYYKNKVNGTYNLWDTHIFIPHGETSNSYVHWGVEYRRWGATLNNTYTPCALDVFIKGNYGWSSSVQNRTYKIAIRPVCSKQ